ncbi:MAG TPA: CPBP family intramembrane glutamic endopeptidase [Deinococcales bacterium]|nr:CPBP family intramembrane glutamic endopeptidase [Deinococcales bacterium]
MKVQPVAFAARPFGRVVSETPAFGVLARRPLAWAVALTALQVLLGLAAGLAAKRFLPGVDPSLAALVLVSPLPFLILAVTGSWRAAGFSGPRGWQNLGLLVLPAIVSLVAPLLAGVKALPLETLGVLVFGYALTGLYEEAWSRGLILGLLRPLGDRRAVFLSAGLFAALHATNFLFRNPAIVAAQMVGAFCFGVAFAALRLRTNALWLLMGLHLGHDLLLKLTGFPAIPLDVAQDAVLLFYALWLLRERRAAAVPATA